jgi:hypothetical protein
MQRAYSPSRRVAAVNASSASRNSSTYQDLLEAVAHDVTALWRLTGRSCASRLGRPHLGDSIFVDLDHVASGVYSARKAFEPFRSPRNDRVGVGAGLDRVTLFDLLLEERVETILASP